MKIRLASLSVGTLVASLLLAGCGSDSKPAAPVAVAVTPPPPPPPPPPYLAPTFFWKNE
jgi:hypothetical protein